MSLPIIEQLLQRIEKLEKSSGGLNYSDFVNEKSSDTVRITGYLRGSKMFEQTKEGYYPLAISNFGFTESTSSDRYTAINSVQFTEQSKGKCTVEINYNSHYSETFDELLTVTVLWVKMD